MRISMLIQRDAQSAVARHPQDSSPAAAALQKLLPCSQSALMEYPSANPTGPDFQFASFHGHQLPNTPPASQPSSNNSPTVSHSTTTADVVACYHHTTSNYSHVSQNTHTMYITNGSNAPAEKLKHSTSYSTQQPRHKPLSISSLIHPQKIPSNDNSPPLQFKHVDSTEAAVFESHTPPSPTPALSDTKEPSNESLNLLLRVLYSSPQTDDASCSRIPPSSNTPHNDGSDCSGTLKSTTPAVTPPAGQLEGFFCSFPSCGRKFQRRQHMMCHYTSHFDVKPYACELCTTKFRRKQDLYGHERKVHGLPYRRAIKQSLKK